MEFNINGWEALILIILIMSLYYITKEIIIAITYNNIVKNLIASKLPKEKCEEIWDKILPPLDESKEKPNKTKMPNKNED